MAESKSMTTADFSSKNQADQQAQQDQPTNKVSEQARQPAVKRVEAPVKGAETEPTSTGPYPSQADLDAIKDGTFKRRRRDMRTEGTGLDYKTR